MHGHRRVAPDAIPAGMHLIYMFGDPRDAVVSFFARRERRHERHHFFLLPNRAEPRPKWVMWHLANLEVSPEPVTEAWDLARYLGHDRDVFKLEEHATNWLLCDRPYRITFIRYEALWENLDALAQHLGLAGINLASKVERASSWQSLPVEQQQAINQMYGPLTERLDALPDLFYSEAGQHFDVVGNPISI